MNPLLRSFIVRIVICAVVSWLSFRIGGVIGVMSSVTLVGLLLARPILELMGVVRGLVREAAWRPVEGRYWEFKGTPVDVIEDEEHRRWVRASDVQKIVGFTASDGSLRLTYPNGYRTLGSPPESYFSDDALLVHLAKQNSSRALRFRHWVERDIAFPARRLREHRGEPEAAKEFLSGD